VFGHQHVGVNPGLVTRPGQFENGLEGFLGLRRLKERKPVKTTEGDEVKSFCSLESLQAMGHAVIVISPPTVCGVPLIAIRLR
jgi:hypothetical protein